MKNNFTAFFCTILLVVSAICNGQIEKEIVPPFHIKTVSFVQNGQNVIPIFNLNDSFQFQFDDLYGDEANYYYQLVHCDYNWKPSQLSKAEYILGFDDQRIQDYLNSFNTLQLYSHYRQQFPNKFMQFRVSGNYIIKILNEEKEIVFSRKFILFEDLVSVPMQIKRARSIKDIEFKHNVEFSINSKNLLFQNPIQNIQVLLIQNGQFNSGITNIKPMYTIGNDLMYRYNEETQFWAGNEFRFFENKNIQAANNFVSRVDSKETYNSHLYTDNARANIIYTFAPDINGNFLPNNINAEDNEIESDYAWVFFSLSAPTYFGKSDIYINGMFNNFALAPQYKMDFIKETGLYEKALVLKQGFTNYQYVIADSKGVIDYKNAIDGNFFQTESNYITVVYYRENGQRYDRVIGKGVASSVNISN